ncbi:MAG: regulatory protein RecX [Bryobacteraceae bacterium]
MRRLDADALFDYAVKALAARAYPAAELRLKLRQRAARASDVDAVISRLKDYGYLDDRNFAEGYAAARLANRQFGARRVLQDLRGRRVAPSLAERAVRKVYEHVDEDRLIEDYIRRRLRTAQFQDEKELAAAYRKLLRAGFSPAAIIPALKRFARNPESLDSFEPPEETPEE